MPADTRLTRRTFLLASTALAGARSLAGAEQGQGSGPLARWEAGVKVAPVSENTHHAIHTYYLTSPESPDGRSVLFYASTRADGHEGELRVRARATGDELVIARSVATEDAHRAACQQWVCGGRKVAYHNVEPTGEWVVNVVDADGLHGRTVARGRQLGISQPSADIVPLYGPHWNPDKHRGLELVDVNGGDARETSLTPELIRTAYPEWVAKVFGDRPISVFFPVISPDQGRAFFKVATPAGGDFRSKRASDREGFLCYDLRSERLLSLTPRWGHPAWHPNSRDILEVGGVVIDSGSGKTRRLPGSWKFPGSHPSFSPDGTLFTTDLILDRDTPAGPKGHWAVAVGDVATGRSVVVHAFDNSRGARSWRVSHPHPSFSPDGRRLYFNVSDGPWTRLHVAEAAS